MSLLKHAARFAATTAVVALIAPVSLASAQGKVSPCPDRDGSSRPSHCEIRELTVPVVGNTLSIDATPNGGISVEDGTARRSRFVPG